MVTTFYVFSLYQTIMTSSPYDQANGPLIDYIPKTFQKLESESLDSSTSNILYKNDPDTNCFAQLKQVSFRISEYYSENDLKSSVDLQKIMSDFSLIHINVRNLPKNVMPFNVMGLTETWLTKDNADLYEFNNYKHIYRCREDQKGGGVSLYLSPGLVYKERHDIEKYFTLSAEAVIVEIHKTIIACIYRPPSYLAQSVCIQY